jgi:hypothetical protein
VIKRIFANRNILLLIMLLDSSCLFLTDDKKAGIPFLRELFIVAVLASALVLMITWKRVHHSSTAVWIAIFGLGLPVLSAVLAHLSLGQPLMYGLLEERRSFLYLLFFPCYYLMIKTRPTQEQLEQFFLVSGLACVVIGFAYHLGIVAPNANVSFNVDEKDFGANPLRPDRYRIGTSYMSLCAFMLMYSLKRRITVTKVAVLLVFAANLWLVNQTRNVMLIWALGGLWIFRSRPTVLLKMVAMILGLLVIAYGIKPEFFIDQYEKFTALVSEATDAPSVRSTTIAIILSEVQSHWFTGMGALSLQWQGGFSSLYSSYFYLSDVGILGVYYRFGILAPIIAVIYYLGFWRIMRQSSGKGDLLAAFRLDFAFAFLNLVLSNSIMYGGEISGIAAAIFLYLARQPSAAFTMSSQEPLANGPVQHRHYQPQ